MEPTCLTGHISLQRVAESITNHRNDLKITEQIKLELITRNKMRKRDRFNNQFDNNQNERKRPKNPSNKTPDKGRT